LAICFRFGVAWSLGAQASETLIDFGARKAQVKEARAAYDQAVAQYRQTALTAFQQTEDGLAAMRVLGQVAAERTGGRRPAGKPPGPPSIGILRARSTTRRYALAAALSSAAGPYRRDRQSAGSGDFAYSGDRRGMAGCDRATCNIVLHWAYHPFAREAQIMGITDGDRHEAAHRHPCRPQDIAVPTPR
jgi:hypothetical protein